MSMHCIRGDFRYYIVGIVPEKEGNFSAYVIDFPEVAAGGDTIEEAIESAFYGISVALRDRIDRDIEIPKPSDMGHVVAMTKVERAEAELPYPENVHYQYVKSPSIDTTPTLIEVTAIKSDGTIIKHTFASTFNESTTMYKQNTKADREKEAKRLYTTVGLTQKEIAQRLNRSQAWVSGVVKNK